MVNIHNIKFAGLFSYAEDVEVSCSDRMVFVGPNNSGKSNIFRILELFIDTLRKFRRLEKSDVFSSSKEPYVKIKMTLSDHEIEKILDFMCCYKIGNNRFSKFYEIKNKIILLNLMNEVEITLRWEFDIETQYSEPYLEFKFSKIDLNISGKPFSNLAVSNKPQRNENFPLRSELKLYQLLDQVSKSEQPNKLVAKLLDEKPEEFLSVEMIRYGRDKEIDKKSMLKISELYSFMEYRINSNHELSFTSLIGKIFSRGFHYARGKIAIFDAEKFAESLKKQGDTNNDFNNKLEERIRDRFLERADALEYDGKNLAQFLFSLMTSSNYEKKKQFEKIKQAFEEIIGNERLTINVSMVYEPVRSETYFEDKESFRPKIPKIFIFDNILQKSFALENTGSGLTEILYILAACYGTKNSVILLDEPTVNLHPTMMKVLMRYLKGQTDNQFLIITHSASLVEYELFENEGDVYYVKKSDSISNIHSLKGEVSDWFRENRTKLKYIIDPRIFFWNFVILTEGESDKNFLLGISQMLASKNKELDLEMHDILITDAGGKQNFEKYLKLFDSLKIPYLVLADSDATSLFPEYSYITKEIAEKGSSSIFVIKEGNLEDFLCLIDSKTFNQLRKEFGRSKPVIASEFVKKITKEKPNAFDSISSFLEIAISKTTE